jgi:hypothetical protein
MRRAIWLSVLLLLAIPAFGQTQAVKPPELWGHWIGQTEAEFFSIEGVVPKQYCAPQVDSEEQARIGPEFTAQKIYPCKRLRRAFDPYGSFLDDYFENGEYASPDPSGSSPDMSVLMGKVSFYGGYLMPTMPTRRAVFVGGRMVAIYDVVPNFKAAVKDLTAKFGKPVSLAYSVEENALGATWRIGRAHWSHGSVGIWLDQVEEFGARGAQIAMVGKAKRAAARRRNMFNKR